MRIFILLLTIIALPLFGSYPGLTERIAKESLNNFASVERVPHPESDYVYKFVYNHEEYPVIIDRIRRLGNDVGRFALRHNPTTSAHFARYIYNQPHTNETYEEAQCFAAMYGDLVFLTPNESNFTLKELAARFLIEHNCLPAQPSAHLATNRPVQPTTAIDQTRRLTPRQCIPHLTAISMVTSAVINPSLPH